MRFPRPKRRPSTAHRSPTTQALTHSGKLLAAQALQSPDTAVTVRRRNGKVSVTDGPFIETKEYLGGFILIEARDRDEAIEIASTVPVGHYGPIEVRPVYTCPIAGGNRLRTGIVSRETIESLSNPARNPYIPPCRSNPAMAINGHRNKPCGPGGSTRRLHPSPLNGPHFAGCGGGEIGSTRA